MERLKTKKMDVSAEAKAKAADIFEKIGTKQIMGHARIQHPGQAAVNRYILEDESEVMEDDTGKPVAKWPEQESKEKRVQNE